MPIGSSSGDYYPDESALLVDQNKMPSPQPIDESRSKVYITKPNVEDRSNYGLVGSLTAGMDYNAIGQKLLDLKKYGLGMSGIDRGNAINVDENQVEETPLSKELGSSSIRMPLGSSTEPAGALKPEEGTQTPGKGSQQESKVKFTTASPLINITDEDIETGMNVAMSAGPGTMAGVKSAAIKGKLADLGHAQVLESNAEHPDQILKKTGFFRGADGRWRYEIDDSKASFDRQWADVEEGVKNPPLLTTKLSKILDHPELYKAYPELKDVKVTHNFMADSSFWDRSSNEIVMASQHIKNQGVLMHEIQHAIQDIEGFAKGGSPGVAGEDFMLKYAPAMRNLEPEMARLVDKKDSGIALTKAEEARAAWLTKVAKKYLEYHKAGNEEAMRYYLRLTGETEARNVDTRLLMTEAERRKLHPMHTEDVAAPHQISVDEAVSTSAYGVTDPKTGRLMKSVEPTHFRRAANDNLSEGHPDRPYNVREPNMIGSNELDRHVNENWNNFKAEMDKHNEFIKKYDELHAFGQKILSSKKNWTEFNVARYNKLGRELEPDWVDLKLDPLK